MVVRGTTTSYSSFNDPNQCQPNKLAGTTATWSPNRVPHFLFGGLGFLGTQRCTAFKMPVWMPPSVAGLISSSRLPSLKCRTKLVGPGAYNTLDLTLPIVRTPAYFDSAASPHEPTLWQTTHTRQDGGKP